MQLVKPGLDQGALLGLQVARPVRQADAGPGRDRAGPRLHGRPGTDPGRGERCGGRPMIAALRARSWGLLVFLLIAALVIGGLGWVAAAALR